MTVARHPLVETADELASLLTKLDRLWQKTVEEVEDPDASDKLSDALHASSPFPDDLHLEDFVVALHGWAEKLTELLPVVRHFLDWDSCTTYCGLIDYDVPDHDHIDAETREQTTCQACLNAWDNWTESK